MKLEYAKTYILYCKFPDMNRFEMLAPGGYTTRRKVFAGLYQVINDDDAIRFNKLAEKLRNEYPEAQFEFRLA